MKLDARREHRRPINILLNKYVDGVPYLCRGVNLSRGGILLYKVFEPETDHSEVTLEFQLPGSDRVIRVSGVTLQEHRWARAHGVRFQQMEDADRVAIEDYLCGRDTPESASRSAVEG